MYRINNNIDFYFQENQDNLIIIKRAIGEIYEVKCDLNAIKFLQLLKQNDGFVRRRDISEEHRASVSFLCDYGILTDEPLPDKSLPLRTMVQSLKDSNLSVQESFRRISNARIAVIGVGGSGAHIACHLADLGFRYLTLIDGDNVETANLNRQPFKKDQVGINKAKSLKENLEDKYDHLVIESVESFIKTFEEMDSYLKYSDIVLIAADNPTRDKAAKFFSSWCLENNKTHLICGGYSGHSSSLGLTVIPNKTPCYLCYTKTISKKLPQLCRDEKLFLSGPVNTSGLITNVIIATAFTAQEVLNLVTGRKLMFSGAHYDLILDPLKFSENSFEGDPECPWCKDLKK